MKTRFLLYAALWFLFLPGLGFGTTVTGTLKDVSAGALVTRGDYVTFQLLGYGRNVPRVTATNIVMNREPLKVYCNSSGQISTFIQANETISPSVTVSITPTGAVRSSNVVTITTTGAHGFTADMTVVIAGVTDTSFNGTFQIVSAPTTSTFTFAQVAGDATSGNGTATVPATFYRVVFYQNGGAFRQADFLITGATYNLNSAVALTTEPVAATGTGESIYLRIDAGNTNLTGTNSFVFGEVNNVVYSASFAGATADAKLVAAFAVLPASGGRVVDTLEGAQSWAASPFTGLTKAVDLEIGASTVSLAVSTTVPSNVRLRLKGTVFSIPTGVTLTIQGPLEANSVQVFSLAGTGAVSFQGSNSVDRVLPQWFGALGDGSTDDQPEIQAAIDAAKTLGTGARKGGTVFLSSGNYLIQNPLVLPRSGATPTTIVWLEGVGRNKSVLTGGSSFPVNRAMVEWDATATHAQFQVIKDLSFVPPTVHGTMCLWWKPTAKGTRVVADGNITTGTATFTSATAGFASGDVGRQIEVFGAGPNGRVLTTGIAAYVNPTTVTLANNASTTVSGNVAIDYKLMSAWTNLSSVATTGGSDTITSTTNPWVSGDVGKGITIWGGGPNNMPLEARIYQYDATNQVRITVPAVSAGTFYGAMYANDSTFYTNERLQITLENVDFQTWNDYHAVAALLQGDVVASNFTDIYGNAAKSTAKYDTITLALDTTSLAAGMTETGGLNFSSVRNLYGSYNRGGFEQVFRGRSNNSTFVNVLVGRGSRANPSFELHNSWATRVEGLAIEPSGAKPHILFNNARSVVIHDLGMGGSQDDGLGGGNGIEFYNSQFCLVENRPLFRGAGGYFSTTGFDALVVDATNQYNSFLNFAVSQAAANEINATNPAANHNYIEGYDYSANAAYSFGAQRPRNLWGTASLDFTALAANSCEVLTITVTGAADGDPVTLGIPNALADVDGATERTVFLGWVSAANTVSVRRCNVTGTVTTDPAAATVGAEVEKH